MGMGVLDVYSKNVLRLTIAFKRQSHICFHTQLTLIISNTDNSNYCISQAKENLLFVKPAVYFLTLKAPITTIVVCFVFCRLL